MISQGATAIDHADEVSIVFQLVCIGVSFLILLACLYVAVIIRFAPMDKPPMLESITPQMIEEFGGNPAEVNIGFLIQNYPVFDLTRGQVTVIGVVFFEFDPTLISLESIGKFTFEQAQKLEISKPHLRIIDNKLFAYYNIKAVFDLQLQYSHFPIDDHRLTFILRHMDLTPSQIQLRSSPSEFVIQADMRSLGWTTMGHTVETGFQKIVLDEYNEKKIVDRPSALFIIDYERTEMRYPLMIILPLLLIFFLTLFSLSLNPERYRSTIMGISTGGITAILAYRFVIEAMSPKVGYFMLSDYIFTLLLVATFFVFLMSIFSEKVSGTVKKIFIVGVHSMVDVSLIYLLVIWMAP